MTKSTESYNLISNSFVKRKNSQEIGTSRLLRKELPPILKIAYPNCCGIDIHKTFVVAIIAITTKQGITEYYRKRFSTFTNSLIQLRDQLEYYSCFDICVESTGKYWTPVFNILEKSCNICLAHPKYVKAIRGKKTDKKDAQWIADLFRYRLKLTQLQVSEKNRYQNCLTWSNLQIASVISDVFVKVLKLLSRASLTTLKRSQILNR